MVEQGESPEEMMLREAKEEAGLILRDCFPISRYLSNPGNSTQEVFLYAALTDLSAAGGIHGLAEEGEDIRVVKIPATKAIALLDEGKIRNALTIIALQWFKASHIALREGQRPV